MKTICGAAITVAALLAANGSALADGFTYAGSPKLGAFYVRDKAQSSREWANARAQMQQPVIRQQVRGGIGLRAP